MLKPAVSVDVAVADDAFPVCTARSVAAFLPADSPDIVRDRVAPGPGTDDLLSSPRPAVSHEQVPTLPRPVFRRDS